MNGILFASHPCHARARRRGRAGGQRPAAAARPGPGPAGDSSPSVRPSVRHGVPKVRFASPRNVKKRQSNSYISTWRFHRPETTRNETLFEVLFVTLGYSGIHLAQENAWFRDVDFCILRFAIYHVFYKEYSIFAKVKKHDADSLRHAWSRGPRSGPRTRKRCI